MSKPNIKSAFSNFPKLTNSQLLFCLFHLAIRPLTSKASTDVAAYFTKIQHYSLAFKNQICQANKCSTFSFM